MVRRARHFQDLEWSVKSVSLDEVRIIQHSDAAFQNTKGGASQVGCIIGLTTEALQRDGKLHGGPLRGRAIA